VNKELYGQVVVLPDELTQYLQQCFEQVPNYEGKKEDAPYVLNGGDYMNNWVTSTIDSMRNGTHTNQEVQDVMPEDLDDQLIKDMGWLSGMNRDAKSHKDYNDDIKITENLKRINEIMKKTI